MARSNLNREIWEGWTPAMFIQELEPMFNMIMSGNSWRKPFSSREALKQWCCDNQPCYKKYIPEVVNYFAARAGL